MKNTVFYAALTLAMLIFNSSFAENGATEITTEEDKDIISGIVKTEKDKSGNITQVTVACSGKSDSGQDEIINYSVNLDEKGKELGMKLAGKNVEIVGVITRKEKGEGEELWIKALSFNEAAPPAGEEPLPEQ